MCICELVFLFYLCLDNCSIQIAEAAFLVGKVKCVTKRHYNEEAHCCREALALRSSTLDAMKHVCLVQRP